MDKLDKSLLKEIADLHEIPQGVYNIRKNGETIARETNDEIQIVSKKDKNGIDVFVKPGVKGKSLHIPVIITVSDLTELVYNDFYIGEDADVLIVAGCGIHNPSDEKSEHDGVHSFHLGKNAKVRYVEKHLGVGKGNGEKVLNPTTVVKMGHSSYMEMETIQLGGVTYSNRNTKATLGKCAKLVIKEKILTEQNQIAKTNFLVSLKGEGSSVEVISRSVAKGNSRQTFISNLQGKNECFGHVECDGIVLDNAVIESAPKVIAKNINASLIHEAAIGKIAGEQLIKLQTLGLTEEEAKNEIIKGFLR